jgi:hypothetical protein
VAANNCGNPERHEYELYLAVEDVDHTRTKTKSPQTTDAIDKGFLRYSILDGLSGRLQSPQDCI